MIPLVAVLKASVFAPIVNCKRDFFYIYTARMKINFKSMDMNKKI